MGNENSSSNHRLADKTINRSNRNALADSVVITSSSTSSDAVFECRDQLSSLKILQNNNNNFAKCDICITPSDGSDNNGTTKNRIEKRLISSSSHNTPSPQPRAKVRSNLAAAVHLRDSLRGINHQKKRPNSTAFFDYEAFGTSPRSNNHHQHHLLTASCSGDNNNSLSSSAVHVNHVTVNKYLSTFDDVLPLLKIANPSASIDKKHSELFCNHSNSYHLLDLSKRNHNHSISLVSSTSSNSSEIPSAAKNALQKSSNLPAANQQQQQALLRGSSPVPVVSRPANQTAVVAPMPKQYNQQASIVNEENSSSGEQFVPGSAELFVEENDLDFFEKKSSDDAVYEESDLHRQSLYVNFDPLVSVVGGHISNPKANIKESSISADSLNEAMQKMQLSDNSGVLRKKHTVPSSRSDTDISATDTTGTSRPPHGTFTRSRGDDRYKTFTVRTPRLSSPYDDQSEADVVTASTAAAAAEGEEGDLVQFKTPSPRSTAATQQRPQPETPATVVVKKRAPINSMTVEKPSKPHSTDNNLTAATSRVDDLLATSPNQLFGFNDSNTAAADGDDDQSMESEAMEDANGAAEEALLDDERLTESQMIDSALLTGSTLLIESTSTSATTRPYRSQQNGIDEQPTVPSSATTTASVATSGGGPSTLSAVRLQHQAELAELNHQWQVKMNDRERHISERDSRLAKLERELKEMRTVVSEYEKTLQQTINTGEKVRTASGESLADIIKQRDQAIEDLCGVESSFADLHRRYEKLKTGTEEFRKNEEHLKARLSEYQAKLKKAEDRWTRLKQQAEEKLEAANAEIERLEQLRDTDTLALRAQLKRSELQVQSLDKQLEQKNKEIHELTSICDELIAKAQVKQQ